MNTVHVLSEVLDAESQQLVVLNGDLITGENAYQSNSTLYLDQIIGPIQDRGLPFASTYGNHDSSFNLSRYDILARERRYRNSYTSSMVRGPAAGVSNYYLPVYPYLGGSTPSLILWFFESRGGVHYQQRSSTGDFVGQSNWVDQSVVDWFQKIHAELCHHYRKVVPSLAFVHIPTNASRALQTEAKVHPHYQPGLNDDYILDSQARGWCSNGTDGAVSIAPVVAPSPSNGADVPSAELYLRGSRHPFHECHRLYACSHGTLLRS